jgi:hypothetical protein
MAQAFNVLSETKAQGFCAISGRRFWQQTLGVLKTENSRENMVLHRVIQNEPPIF